MGNRFVSVVLCLLLTSFISAQTWVPDIRQQTLIDSLLKDFPSNTELAFAIIKQGNTHFFGLKKDGNNYQLIENQNSIFEIGSVSKVFTSTLLCQLVTENKLSLNDRISKYLLLKNKPKISFKQLSNHTSGLPRLPSNIFNSMVENPQNPYLNYGEKELLFYLENELKLLNKNGEGYQYSNLGAGLLRYTLAQITKSTYEKLIQDRLFLPLGMKQSTTDRKNVTGTQVKALDNGGKEASFWDFNVLTGAGGILSSASDVSKFVIANLDTLNPVFQLQQTKTFEINESFGVALGWHLIHDGPFTLHWHNGATGGFQSSVVMDVRHQNAVLVLSNVCPQHQAHENIDLLSIELVKTLQNDK